MCIYKYFNQEDTDISVVHLPLMSTVWNGLNDYTK